MGDEIKIEWGDPTDTAKLWECPDCAFAFDAMHKDADGGHTCPCCALASANALNERLVAALTSASRRLDAIADGAAEATMPGLEMQAREWADEAHALLADIEESQKK